MQDCLFEMQSKVSRGTSHWRNKATIEKRYKERCGELHLPSDIYKVEISVIDGALAFNFKKNYYKIERYLERLGKNILITDIEDWETEEIVQSSLDRWAVEEGFRLTKDEEQIAMRPIRHWTDSKIRCHIFTCIAALTLLRLIELRLRRAGLNITAKTAMQSMRQLHSCLLFMPQKKETFRMLEDPDDLQGQIIRTFGAQIVDGVLQR